ncbi:hypothetical protein GQ53DRAFT_745831 [Thozetella sp. PMI_491]|nr:hypothetical protein GQ53DRAFT_745831 [Thozetella sp. PMI_491]
MRLTLTFPTAALLATVAIDPAAAASYEIPNSLHLGSVEAEYTAGCGNIDGPRVFPRPNATSYDWWYFDVVSTSSANESVTVVFYESSSTAFLSLYPPLLAASITGTLADGSSYDIGVVPENGVLDSAIIEADGDSISGIWQGTGFSFRGSEGLTKYVIEIDNPLYEVSGTVTFEAIAPPHLPCGLYEPGETEVILPGVGWSNALPGALANVNLTVKGHPISFSGIGYHDKNWGDVSFYSAVQSWYWGHAQLGPYTLVWFDAISKEGDEWVSGYVARDGEIVHADCEVDVVKVRPFGDNSAYPPEALSGDASGFTIEYNLGEKGMLRANVTAEAVQLGAIVYWRDIGAISGGFVGQEQYTGRALWDQIKLP